MIRLENVSKHFRLRDQTVRAVDRVDLEVKQGEIFGIIGYSGAGKSTLIRMINLLEQPTGGKVFVGGNELTAQSKANLRKSRQQIGMIFQQFNLLSSRTVAGNVAYPLEVAGGNSRQEISRRVALLLEWVGLSDKAGAYPSQLSGGQKQRVGIARALANDPQVLLCDEATSALDPETTFSILQLLREINARLGLTIVLVTHEMQVVQAICDRVAVMEKGLVVELGSTTDVFNNPQSAVARRFVSGMPIIRRAEAAKSDPISFEVVADA